MNRAPLKRILTATIALVAMSAAPAFAADVPMPVPIMAPVMNWTGFYVGVNGGYSWGRASRDVTFFNPATGSTLAKAGTGTTDSNLNGGLFGGQIGFNWQAADWVYGLETDAQWTGQRGSASATCPGIVTGGPCLPGLRTVANLDQKLEWFGTLRGRIGSLAAPSVIVYATGGAAYGTVKTDIALAGFTSSGVPIGITGSSSDTRAGWTVGAGAEWMFVSNWTAKVEYLYVDLGTITSSAVLPTATGLAMGASVNSRIQDNLIRGGINYKF